MISLREKIFARESLGTTGIGRGVAVPHARIEEINDIILYWKLNKMGLKNKKEKVPDPV